MNETLVMNASSGLMNLSVQTPTIGTIGGIGLIVVLIIMAGGMYLAHEINSPKSLIRKLLDWLNKVGAFKAVIGGWTVGFGYGIYLVSGWFGSSGGQETILNVLGLAAGLVVGFVALVAVGYAAEPIWTWAWNYVMNNGKKTKKGVGIDGS